MRYSVLAATILILLPTAARADVLASVDESTLTWEQLVSMVGGEENRQYLAVGSEAEAEEMLRSWVREELVVRAAMADGMDQRPEIAYAIDQAVRQILLEAYLGEQTADVEMSLLTVENYVSAWRGSYEIEIHARHILLPDMAQAQAAQARLQAGESFDVLAQEVSICPSAAEGGDLGWLRRGQAVLGFEEAAFSLSPGQTSGIIETSMGFHIIKLLETRPIVPAPSDEEIFQLAGDELMMDAQETAVMTLLDSLETLHAVSVYPERLLEHVSQ